MNPAPISASSPVYLALWVVCVPYKVQRMISFLFTPFKSLVPCTNVISAIIEKRIAMEFWLNYMCLSTLRLSSGRTRECSN